MSFTDVCVMACPLCFDGTNEHPFHSERKMSDVFCK